MTKRKKRRRDLRKKVKERRERVNGSKPTGKVAMIYINDTIDIGEPSSGGDYTTVKEGADG